MRKERLKPWASYRQLDLEIQEISSHVSAQKTDLLGYYCASLFVPLLNKTTRNKTHFSTLLCVCSDVCVQVCKCM